MVIDVHTHVFEAPEAFPRVWLQKIFKAKEEQLGREIFERWKIAFDGRVETLISDMDEAGIDKSVALPLDLGIICQEEPEISIWRTHEYIAEAQRRYPDRIIGFAGIDPRRKDAIELLEKGVTEWGLRGVKLWPSDFYINDERFEPFMKKINDLEVPILTHTGTDPLPYHIRYGNPVDLLDLVAKYPKMKVIAAHLARGFEDTLVAMMFWNRQTIYTDLAAAQYEYWKSPWHLTMELRYLMDKVPDSILMGTDWPFIKFPPLPTHKEWFDFIRNLKIPEAGLALGMKDFSQEEKDKILGENARALLKC